MVMFALNPTEVRNGYNNAAANPYVPERDNSAGFFEGSLTALPTGFEQAGGEIALMFSDKENEAAIQSNLKAMRPDPQTSGWLANVLQGVGSVIPPAVVGTLATGGNPIGGALAVGETKGYTKMKELQAEGVDEATAAKAGAVEGITQGLGVMVPASVGGSITKRLASGAAINLGIGAAQRGATGKILESNGYKEMADQYRVIDGMAMFTDAILGGMFGALHTEGGRAEIREPLPSEKDAALAANNIHQLEIESAPGIPADIATRNAHVDAMDVATEQLLRGEPVDVAKSIADSNFLAKPDNPEVRTAIDEALVGNGLSSSPAIKEEALYLPVPKKPASLTDWIRQNGGMRDEGGDIRSVLGGAKYRPGLISKNGLGADDLAIKAWEQGFFPETGERPTVNDFLNKVTEDISGKKQYSLKDNPEAISYHDATAYNAEIDRLANTYGVDTAGKNKAHFWDEVSSKMSEEQHNAELSARQSAFELEYTQAERKFSEWLTSRGDSWEPESLTTRSLQDLENEYRQEKAAGVTPESNQSRKASSGEGRASRDSGGVQEGRNTSGDSIESTFSKEAVQEIVSENPDLKIIDENGEVISAADALAKADEEIAQAENDSKLFDVAVNCFLRNGDA